ncbi:MAG: hypothetical protein AAF514_11995 [Verrucomicrobiota bacterium]
MMSRLLKSLICLVVLYPSFAISNDRVRESFQSWLSLINTTEEALPASGVDMDLDRTYGPNGYLEDADERYDKRIHDAIHPAGRGRGGREAAVANKPRPPLPRLPSRKSMNARRSKSTFPFMEKISSTTAPRWPLFRPQRHRLPPMMAPTP